MIKLMADLMVDIIYLGNRLPWCYPPSYSALVDLGVDIVDSSIALSIGVLLDLVIGKDSTVHGTSG